MLDCIFIGSTTKDTLLLVDAPPASDQRIAASAVVHTCGGVASVAASAFQKLGGQAGLITVVGDDSEVTAFIEADLNNRNLPWLQLIRIPGADSPFSTIQVERDGKRCITHFGGCIRQLSLELLDRKILISAQAIHLGGLEEAFCVELARWCRSHTGALLSVDGGNLSAEAIEQLLPCTDVFIPDEKTVLKTLGAASEEACRYYVSRGVKIACVTMGDKGSVACSGDRIYQAPSVPVRVVDTTGAGDNFHGAFLYALQQGWEMDRILRFCNTFSALTCRALGGRTAEPTLTETIKQMEEN